MTIVLIVFLKGGNAIDAAITTTFCLALVEPHVTGIGGGGLMLVHSHRRNTSVVIDFRETAPENARNDRYIQNPLSASLGRKSIGIPGFVKGLEHAFKKYGSGHIGFRCCSWMDLIRKAITEAMKSQSVSDHFLNATHTKIAQEELEGDLLKSLIQSAQAGKPFRQIPIFMELVKTLESIASNGSAAMYEGGTVGQQIVQDLGGAITLEDLAAYQVVERIPLKETIGKHEVMVSPAPSSGPELLAILNSFEYLKHSMKNFGDISAQYLHTLANIFENLEDLQLRLGDSTPNSAPTTDHQLLFENSVKNMLDKRNTAQWTSDIQKETLGSDPNYALSDPVAANVAVMDKKDNYVSVVTSLNTWFGSKVMGKNGILYNNAMANFAIPSESGELETFNQLATGRRPLTSNVVALSMDVSDICGTRIVTGGATASSVGQVLAYPLLLQSDLRSSVDAARIDVQNSTIFLENVDVRGSFKAKVVSDFLHLDEVSIQRIPFTSVNAVEKTVDQPMSIKDFRSGTGSEDSYSF